MLQMHRDSREALVDLALELLNRLVLVCEAQTIVLFMVGLCEQQVLIAEAVGAQLEFEALLFSVSIRSFADELSAALGRLECALVARAANEGVAVKSELRHHIELALSLDTHVLIVEALDH